MKAKLQLQHKVSADETHGHQDHQTASELPEMKEVPAVDEHVGSAAADIGDAQEGILSKKKNQVCIYFHDYVQFLLIWITFFI
jgi:hypothetical protein